LNIFSEVYISCNFGFFSIFFIPKAYFLEALDGALFIWTLWVFLLKLPILKMASTILNINFLINLGRFVGD